MYIRKRMNQGQLARKTDAQFLIHEVLSKKIDDSLQALLKLHQVATTHNDPQLANFLEGEYLKEKVESQKEIGDLITKLKRSGDNVGIHIIDKELQEMIEPPTLKQESIRATIEMLHIFWLHEKFRGTYFNCQPISIKYSSQLSHRLSSNFELFGLHTGFAYGFLVF